MKRTSILFIVGISFLIGGLKVDTAHVSAATTEPTESVLYSNKASETSISVEDIVLLNKGESLTGYISRVNSMTREATGYHLANVKYKITKGKLVYNGIAEKGSSFKVGLSIGWKGFSFTPVGYTTYTKGIYKEYTQHITVKWTAQKLDNATNRVLGVINENRQTSYKIYKRVK